MKYEWSTLFPWKQLLNFPADEALVRNPSQQRQNHGFSSALLGIIINTHYPVGKQEMLNNRVG